MSASRIFTLIVASSWLLLGCGDSSKKIVVGGTCVLDSDCAGTLVCTMGKCHDACHTSADCPVGQSCVKANNTMVCQLPVEAACRNAPCTAAFVCASDLQCRTPCQAVADCGNGQVCVTNVCADPGDLDVNGQLPQKSGGVDGGANSPARDTGDKDTSSVGLDVPGTGGPDLTVGHPDTGGGIVADAAGPETPADASADLLSTTLPDAGAPDSSPLAVLDAVSGEARDVSTCTGPDGWCWWTFEHPSTTAQWVTPPTASSAHAYLTTATTTNNAGFGFIFGAADPLVDLTRFDRILFTATASAGFAFNVASSTTTGCGTDFSGYGTKQTYTFYFAQCVTWSTDTSGTRYNPASVENIHWETTWGSIMSLDLEIVPDILFCLGSQCTANPLGAGADASVAGSTDAVAPDLSTVARDTVSSPEGGDGDGSGCARGPGNYCWSPYVESTASSQWVATPSGQEAHILAVGAADGVAGMQAVLNAGLGVDLSGYDQLWFDATVPSGIPFAVQLKNADTGENCSWILTGNGTSRYTLDLTSAALCWPAGACGHSRATVADIYFTTPWWGTNYTLKMDLTDLGFATVSTNPSPVTIAGSASNALNNWCWSLFEYGTDLVSSWKEPPSSSQVHVYVTAASTTGQAGMHAELPLSQRDLSAVTYFDFDAAVTVTGATWFQVTLKSVNKAWHQFSVTPVAGTHTYSLLVASPDYSGTGNRQAFDPTQVNLIEFESLWATTAGVDLSITRVAFR